MGFREPDKLDGTITDIFMKVVNDEVIPEGYAIHSVAERLDLIPSSIDLSAAGFPRAACSRPPLR